MPTIERKLWEKYWDKFPYLLPYKLDQNFPYKRLAEELGVHTNSVREMVRWMQVQPEVIRYLREGYAEEDIPSWVGEIGDAPTTTDEVEAPTTMEEDDSTTTTEEEEDSTEDEGDVEEEAPVQPVQPKAIERVQKMVVGGGGKKEQVVVASGEVVVGGGNKNGGGSGGNKGGGQGGGKNEAPPSPPKPEKKKAPTPLVEVEKKLTPKRKEPDVKEVITPAQKELVAELQRMQEYDPDIVPLQGGGWTRILRSKTGQPIGTVPVADPTPALSPKVGELMSEATMEKLDINTLALMRRVALNPTVTMGHTYVTNTKDEEGIPLFIGDLAEWINWCCEKTLSTYFGVKFAILTGGPSLMSKLKEMEK